MFFASDEQRKAVMASLYYSGKLYDRSYFDSNYSNRDYFDNSDWSRCIYEFNSKLLSTELSKAREEIEQDIKNLNHKEVQKKIQIYQESCRKKETLNLLNEIQQILSRKEPREYESIKSLSFEYNDLIVRAVRAGIDREIRLLLRDKQQNLAKIMLEHKAVKREISLIDFEIEYYNVNESHYFQIADLIIRAEQTYIEKNTVLELKEKLERVAKILVQRKSQE